MLLPTTEKEEIYFSFSISSDHKRTAASLGIRQSPLGDKLTDPTLGPSGIQLRLNCWLKKRLKNTSIHFNTTDGL